jgi:phosphonate transport system substrate-binding protein
VKEKRYDIVHYNQYHYIQSASDYEVIASNMEQGRDTISGALYVRNDSGITEISQLRGRNIIFGGGTDAMMSYIVPRFLLQQGGLNSSDYHASFANNPPNAVLAVYFKQADASGAGDVVMNLPTVTMIANTEQLRFLAISDPIKHLPWTVRRNLPEELRNKIKQLMVGLRDIDEGDAILKAAHVDAFSPSTDNDYDSAREIIMDVMQENGAR